MTDRSTARRVARVAMAALAVVIILALFGALGSRSPFRPLPSAGAVTPVPPTAMTATTSTTTTTTTTTTTAAPDAAAGPTVERTGPAIVHVGFYINDIQDIDLQRHRYDIDFYVWFRWTEPDIDPAATFEFMNGAEQWGTTKIPATDGPETLADGSFYYREHVQSMFKTNMPLEDYPYDRQDLEIILEDVNASSDELVYVLDDPAAENAPDLSVPGYHVHPPIVEVADVHYPDLGAVGVGGTTASRVVVSIELTRPWLPYTLKIFIPLLLVVLCAALVFLIGPQHVDARFGLGISSLLTLIALKWTTDGEMPLMDYLGLVDSLYILAFAFVAIGLADTTYTTVKRSQGVDDATLQRLDRRILTGALVFLVVGALYIIASHVTR